MESQHNINTTNNNTNNHIPIDAVFTLPLLRVISQEWKNGFVQISTGISKSLDIMEGELIYQEHNDNTKNDEELENEFETDSEEENDNQPIKQTALFRATK